MYTKRATNCRALLIKRDEICVSQETKRDLECAGWRKPIECFKLQDIFRKRATNYRALVRSMTYKHKASYGSSPPCIKRREKRLRESDLCTSKETCMHLQKSPVYLRGDQKRREETQRKWRVYLGSRLSRVTFSFDQKRRDLKSKKDSSK